MDIGEFEKMTFFHHDVGRRGHSKHVAHLLEHKRNSHFLLLFPHPFSFPIFLCLQ